MATTENIFEILSLISGTIEGYNILIDSFITSIMNGQNIDYNIKKIGGFMHILNKKHALIEKILGNTNNNNNMLIYNKERYDIMLRINEKVRPDLALWYFTNYTNKFRKYLKDSRDTYYNTHVKPVTAIATSRVETKA
jgi:hypothetical protein